MNLKYQNWLLKYVQLHPPPPRKHCYHCFPAEGSDYDITILDKSGEFPVLTLTLLPGATEACFVVSIVDDDVLDGETERLVEQVIFFYFSSSPTVARVNLRHRIVILDNDRKG